jgi:hypothetical protein
MGGTSRKLKAGGVGEAIIKVILLPVGLLERFYVLCVLYSVQARSSCHVIMTHVKLSIISSNLKECETCEICIMGRRAENYAFFTHDSSFLSIMQP